MLIRKISIPCNFHCSCHADSTIVIIGHILAPEQGDNHFSLLIIYDDICIITSDSFVLVSQVKVLTIRTS